MPSWRFLTRRRNLREDQAAWLTSIARSTSKERVSISCSAPSGMLPPPKYFSGGRSRAKAGDRGRVSSNSERFASKTTERQKSGMQFSLHEATYAFDVSSR